LPAAGGQDATDAFGSSGLMALDIERAFCIEGISWARRLSAGKQQSAGLLVSSSKDLPFV